MPHATITIDNATVLDSDLTQWQERAPEELTELIQKANTATQPWLKAVMLPLTEAFIHQQDVAISVDTNAHGWSMTVHHPLEAT